MKIICVDDEPLILNMTAELCEKLPLRPEVKGFTRAADALAWLADHSYERLFLGKPYRSVPDPDAKRNDRTRRTRWGPDPLAPGGSGRRSVLSLRRP